MLRPTCRSTTDCDCRQTARDHKQDHEQDHEPEAPLSPDHPQESRSAAQGVLARLNEQQQAAVTHDDSPLLIVAGAGTGKTATLAHRVAHLIASGADPGRMLLLTFTRRAAAEMLRRVEAILRSLPTEGAAGGPASGSGHLGRAAASGKVWGGTFHAVATRLLRLHGRQIGLDPSFTILDRGDAQDMMGVIRTELGLSKNDRRFPLKGTCTDIYSRCINARESVEEAVESHFPWCEGAVDELRDLFSAYVDRKAQHEVFDYDDLLLFWHGLLTDPRASRSVRSRFDHILVDEYQDTNRLQAEILEMLAPQGRGLTVVGDDAQAIYSFRAATVRNILDFPSRFPGTRVVTLEQNYRSTKPLLEATNHVIAQARERHAKDLWTDKQGGAKPVLTMCEDETEQSEYVIAQILEHREAGIPLQRQAVLFRASHHSQALELELTRRNIPFRKYGGLKFVETAHVKDLTAFLRLAENPRDLMAGTRVLMLLPGVGPKRARNLMDRLIGSVPAADEARAADGRSAADAVAPPDGAATDRGSDAADTAPATGAPGFAGWRDVPPPTAAAADFWPELQTLMDRISGPQPGDLATQIGLIRRFYAPLLERLYDNAKSRLADLEQLEALATRFNDRAQFLAEIVLDPPAYTEDLAGPPLLDEDFLILSTIHSAKGLEWDAVYVIHAADGNIPSDMATGSTEEIEEELRLFYVALTRAKDWLYVCYPLRYYTHPHTFRDNHGYALLTRFLSRDVLAHFDQQQAVQHPALAPGDGGQPDDGLSAEAVSTEDIRRRLKEQF